MTRKLLCLLPLLACSSASPAPGPRPEEMHDSCLHACRNVRKVPVCPAEILSAPVSRSSQIIEAATQLQGQIVRVRGRLRKAEGLWTQINCPRNVCCSEQLGPFVSVDDGWGQLALAGQFRLVNGSAEKLSCVSREGAMVQDYGTSPAAPFSFELWNRRRDGEPDPEALERAYCCNLDARGQSAVVEATFEPSELKFAPHRLTNPVVCELPVPAN